MHHHKYRLFVKTHLFIFPAPLVLVPPEANAAHHQVPAPPPRPVRLLQRGVRASGAGGGLERGALRGQGRQRLHPRCRGRHPRPPRRAGAAGRPERAAVLPGGDGEQGPVLHQPAPVRPKPTPAEAGLCVRLARRLLQAAGQGGKGEPPKRQVR